MTKKQLTKREEEVLAFLSASYSNAEIARSLGIAESTVKMHVTNILSKLGASNSLEAVGIYDAQKDKESGILSRILKRLRGG